MSCKNEWFLTVLTDQTFSTQTALLSPTCILLSGFRDNSYLDKQIGTVATETELKAEKDKRMKIQAFDSSYFCGKSHFKDN